MMGAYSNQGLRRPNVAAEALSAVITDQSSVSVQLTNIIARLSVKLRLVALRMMPPRSNPGSSMPFWVQA